MVIFLEGGGKQTNTSNCFFCILIAVGQMSWFGFRFFLSRTSPVLIIQLIRGWKSDEEFFQKLTDRKTWILNAAM